MSDYIEIAGRNVGLGHDTFIIGEAGVNHDGDPKLARRLVAVAAEAGVDAVKFQTFKAERVVSGTAPKADYQLQRTDPSESQLDMLRRLELSLDAHRELAGYCQQRGVLFMSTPFDEESADLLDQLAVPVFKLGSGEITNLPFLRYVARKGMPIILSTGMSYLSEVDEAVRAIRDTGNDQLVLLHCVSNYPADPADANLRAMQTMAMAFGLPVGYSDHTSDDQVALVAVALGACVIEKHFTLDKNLPGPDHRASVEPRQLQALVAGVRTVELALGCGPKAPAPSEMKSRAIVRRSLAAAADIPEGTVLDAEMLQALRPATGISPACIDAVLGRKVKRSLTRGDLLLWTDLA